jgi:hypothetical protein
MVPSAPEAFLPDPYVFRGSWLLFVETDARAGSVLSQVRLPSTRELVFRLANSGTDVCS